MEFSIVKEEGDSAFERFMEKDSSLQNIGANPKVDPTLPVPWEHAKRSGHTNAYTKTCEKNIMHTVRLHPTGTFQAQ